MKQMKQLTDIVNCRFTPELRERLQQIAGAQSNISGPVRISDVLRAAAMAYVERWDENICGSAVGGLVGDSPTADHSGEE